MGKSIIVNSSNCKRSIIQAIFRLGEETAASEIYWNTEQKCRKYTKIIVSYIMCHQSTYVAALFYSIYCIRVGNMDTSTWFLPFHLIVPFDTQTIWGWYLFLLLQFNISLAYIMCMVAITSYFLCSCAYIEAIRDHFKSLINSIHANVKRKEIVKNPQKNEEICQKIKDELNEAIEFHTKMIE